MLAEFSGQWKKSNLISECHGYLAQLARNTGYSVRVNHKVSTSAATSNKQGGVELLNLGLDGFNNLVIEVLICCEHISNSTPALMHTMASLHAGNAWPFGMTRLILEIHAVVKSRAATKRVVAITMALSSFQAH